MSAAGESGEQLRRILRLAPDCDPTSLALTAEEGFLLSRIDGTTPWRLLREIGGMDPEEADLCVEGWIASGVVKVEGLAPEPPRQETRREAPRNEAPPRAGAASRTVDESLIDPALDLDVETQRRILTFETTLDAPYHVLLGVAPDANAKDVKRAYFKLSREFHPDRYFRRQIGGYVARLERIFKKVLEAYEILSDPELRAQLASQPTAPGVEAPPPTAGGDRPARPLTKLERLRQRMPFRMPAKVLAERRQKAGELFRAAQRSAQQGQLQEAASSVRVAISFDPTNAEYRRALVDLQARVAEKRAVELLERLDAGGARGGEDLGRVLKMLDEVLLYRPHDPDLNARAADVALRLGDPARAEVHARTALEHSPDVAAHHLAMGRVLEAQGQPGLARKALERALELDPDDVKARKALASLRLGRTVPPQEGRNG